MSLAIQMSWKSAWQQPIFKKYLLIGLVLLVIVLSILLAVIFVILPNFKDINRQSICLDEQTHFVFQSTCECRKWQKILVVENSSCSMNYSGEKKC